MEFFTGLHQPSDAKHFKRAFVSVNRLRDRGRPWKTFAPDLWIMDSGAFTELLTHGAYRHTPKDYAAEIKRWANRGTLLAAVTQDFMCEPWMLEKTGHTVREHQRLTVERFDQITECDTGGIPILPVLQGYDPTDYANHLKAYGARLPAGAWVGVGSICKRNARPEAILGVLYAIKQERPDLRLHGFGLKKTALDDPRIVGLLHSADSLAWSYAARREGRNANDWKEAAAYTDQIATKGEQAHLFN